ncbi:MAG: hypothetical protein JWQ74_443 [Marmoricola sp.]|nr:hypothetical protein [Marmoricola sp.]
MATRLVEIVNPNGQKGLVPEGSDADLAYPRAKSTAHLVFDENHVPIVDDELKDPVGIVDRGELGADDLPALNASTETWREYATSHGMSDEDAAEKTRDELVDHFTNPSEED